MVGDVLGVVARFFLHIYKTLLNRYVLQLTAPCFNSATRQLSTTRRIAKDGDIDIRFLVFSDIF